jgi:hypothetical protein
MAAEVDRDDNSSIAAPTHGGQDNDGADDDLLDDSPDAELEGYFGGYKGGHTLNGPNTDDKDLLPNIKLKGVAHRWRRAAATTGNFDRHRKLTG